MKKLVASLAILMFYAVPFTASAADKKETNTEKRAPANTELPSNCLTAIRDTAAATQKHSMGNKPSDYTISNIVVTMSGPPPAPADGPDQPLTFKAQVNIETNRVANVSVRMIRGGCIVTNYNE
jgi:hypothetical protein